jgi:hypothetical protein
VQRCVYRSVAPHEANDVQLSRTSTRLPDPRRAGIAPAIAVLALACCAWSSVWRASAQSSSDRGCREWHECRELALSAAERGEYETFHDLAWRAVQNGPQNDPALMFLLARAQSLSGRPHDALIMLERLTEMGIAPDASIDDFSRVRELPDWPTLRSRLDRLRHAPERDAAAAIAAPAPDLPEPEPPKALEPREDPARSEATSVANAAESVAPSAPSTPSTLSALSAVPASLPAAPITDAPAPVDVAVRFAARRFSAGGLAYDAASRRFLFGDRIGRKLIAVSDDSTRTDDLVRSDSAGFQEISAVAIDSRHGALWVASGMDGAGRQTLHHLELVSGHPLKDFQIASDFAPAALTDLAITPEGTVLAVDSAGQRLFALRAGTSTLEPVLTLDARGLTSVTVGSDDEVAYVAHRQGVSRVDLRSRTAMPLGAPRGMSLAHLERIRRFGNALIAVHAGDDGSKRLVRFELNAKGRAVTHATNLGTLMVEGELFVTIAGNDLVYFAGASAAASGPDDLVAYRVHLR